jgi:hypothetical protein
MQKVSAGVRRGRGPSSFSSSVRSSFENCSSVSRVDLLISNCTLCSYVARALTITDHTGCLLSRTPHCSSPCSKFRFAPERCRYRSVMWLSSSHLSLMA